MFENESKNDLETNLQVGVRNARVSWIIIGVASLLLIAIGVVVLVLELVYPDPEPDYFYAILTLVLGVFFLLFFIFYKPFLRMILKKTMQGKESTNSYRFTEEGYEISTKLNDGTASSTQTNYSAVTECKEFRDYWLLYLNKANYFIVVKSGMKTGTAEELSQFLMSKFGAKYKVCYKKK